MIKDYVAFDLETTGLRIESDYIIEIGALKVRDGRVVDRFIEFVKPPIPISPFITNITGITNAMIVNARNISEVIHDFISFCGEDILVGHNILFDYKFIKTYATRNNLSFEMQGIDTLKIAKRTLTSLDSKSLGSLCEYYHIVNMAAHRAYHDALATAKLYHLLAHDYEKSNPKLFVPEQLQYKVKKIQPCTSKQIAYLNSLCEQHQLTFDVDVKKLTKSEASKRIDNIISTYGK